MYLLRPSITSFILTLLFCSCLIGQTAPTESKTEKDEARIKLEAQAFRILDEALNETETLKLWENRALSYAVAGDLFWTKDQKQARAMFQSSADEMIQANVQPKEKSKDYFEEYNYWRQRSPRRMILLMISGRDADLALRLLKETRTADIQKAIDSRQIPVAKNQKRTAKEALNLQKNSFLVSQEISLEQQFAVKAAEQNPEKAAKIIRDSLDKGVSMSALNLIPKVAKKDEELGSSLLSEIINKLIDTKFDKSGQGEMRVASYLIMQTSRPQLARRRPDYQPIKVGDNDLKRLANKIADHLLASTDYQSFFAFAEIAEDLKKYTPTKAAAITKKQEEIQNLLPTSARSFSDAFKKMTDPKATARELIKEARNQPSYQKFEFYKAGVDKAVEKGEDSAVRSLLKSEPDSKQRTDALNYLNKKLSSKAIKDGKLEDAKALIEESETESSKIKMLVDLAIGFEKKQTEDDHNTALNLIREASDMVNQVPESREEVDDILKVASGLAIIEPKNAFSYLNSLSYMVNDLMTAYALIAKYNKRSNGFKNGEIIFMENLNGSFISHGESLARLAEADFGKTSGLVDQFQRQDVKTLAKLLLAQSILKGKITLSGRRGPQFFVSY